MRLTTEAVGGSAQQFLRVQALGSLERFELPDDLRLAALRERGLNRASQLIQVRRFGDAVMRPPRPLQRMDLLVRFQSAGNDNDWHVRQQFLELAQIIQAKFSLRQDMVEDDEVWRALSEGSEGFAGRGSANKLIFSQRFFVNLILEIVVLDDEQPRAVHE